MAFTLPTIFTLGSKSRISDPKIYSGVNELHHNNDSGNSRRNYYYYLWVCIKQMVWRQYNPHLNVFRRNSGFRFGIQHDNSWKRLHTRDSNKSSQSSIRSNRNRKRNRHYFYYGLIISLLTINPVKAEEGETNNTSNPVAAATGNVTNQAVQFQNNGAPSRQVYGPNISCNGATMTFSPFYMGNHTTPFDVDDDHGMQQQSYTVAENWGGQINFMVPLDGSLVERCKAAADRQIEKMELNYELVRIDNCAKLQQKGFMLMPGSRVYHICSDVIPISQWKAAEAKVLRCKSPPKPWYKPWHKPKETCKMSSLTVQRGDTAPNLDGPNDLLPEVKTTRIVERSNTTVDIKPEPKKTTTTKK